MILTSKNIKLRALEPSDVDIIYQWENDTRVWSITNTVSPFSKHVIEQYVANSHLDIYSTKQLRLMIEMNDVNLKGKLIGCVDLFDFDPNNCRAGVGILIADAEERNKGYASETLVLLINYAFNVLNLHQLYCNISVDNEASLKLFQKHEFKIGGIKKEWIRTNDQWVDVYFLQRLHKC